MLFRSEGEEGVNAAVQYFPLAEAFLERCGNIPPAILECIQASALIGQSPESKVQSPEISNSAALNGGQQKNQKEEIMSKKLIVALLLKHGITAMETETDEQLQAKLSQIPMAAAAAAEPAKAGTPNNITDLAAIRAELAEQRRLRIQDRVSAFVDSQQITTAEVPLFVTAALADEKSTLAILAARPVAEVGGEPVGFNQIGRASCRERV